MLPARFSFALTLSLATAALAQPAPAGHVANALDANDVAVLQAKGNTLSGRVITNSCGTPVHPVLYAPAPDVAVVVEADPTGACSGATIPSGVAVLLRTGPRWRISTSTPGTGFRLGPSHDGHPDIIVQGSGQAGCPVLGWTGRGYEMTRPCPRR